MSRDFAPPATGRAGLDEATGRPYPAGMEHRHETPDEPPRILDLRGLKCPLPVLRTRKALLSLPPGGRIDVLCTDPLAGLDIPNLLRERGDALLDVRRDGRETRFAIRKRAGAEGLAQPPGGSNAESGR